MEAEVRYDYSYCIHTVGAVAANTVVRYFSRCGLPDIEGIFSHFTRIFR